MVNYCPKYQIKNSRNKQLIIFKLHTVLDNVMKSWMPLLHHPRKQIIPFSRASTLYKLPTSQSLSNLLCYQIDCHSIAVLTFKQPSIMPNSYNFYYNIVNCFILLCYCCEFLTASNLKTELSLACMYRNVYRDKMCIKNHMHIYVFL